MMYLHARTILTERICETDKDIAQLKRTQEAAMRTMVDSTRKLDGLEAFVKQLRHELFDMTEQGIKAAKRGVSQGAVHKGDENAQEFLERLRKDNPEGGAGIRFTGPLDDESELKRRKLFGGDAPAKLDAFGDAPMSQEDQAAWDRVQRGYVKGIDQIMSAKPDEGAH
jgi:hypothetical protein